MQYQIDNRLTELSANLWKPVDYIEDILPTTVDQHGAVVLQEIPVEGPETNNERFFPLLWQCAKPSRWFAPTDWKSRVVVAERGILVGDVGFDFRFVEHEGDADGITSFVPEWGMR